MEHQYTPPSPELSLIRHGSVLDVGLIGGYRHLAYGSKFSDPFGKVLPDNLIDAQDSGGQTTYPEGDRVRGFFTSRFYQSYFHLYIERTFYFNKRFNAWLGLAPGVEYFDDVKPIQAETVHFVNDRPTADQFYLYTTSYKRIVAYGYLLSLGVNYNVGNVYLQLGFERSNYFVGARYKYLFLGAGFRIRYRD